MKIILIGTQSEALREALMTLPDCVEIVDKMEPIETDRRIYPIKRCDIEIPECYEDEPETKQDAKSYGQSLQRGKRRFS